ncbi:MAG: amidohydrolase family protein [Rhizobiales bacterium]|nr:amidohydrolase family protein [Hyphomicrobiales bacterium]NRB15778.1 amidohydrolase family protein [Hyphomicrobiales bacterium]
MTDAILLRNGKIFDGKNMLDGVHSVLIENGKISQIGNDDIFIGFMGQSHDVSGKTILPGLVDCHVHLCYTASGDPRADGEKMGHSEFTLTALKNAQATLCGGVTAVRDCGGRDFMEFGVRDAINRGEFDGPTIYASGKIICMTGGHGHVHARVADGVEEVRKAVREQVLAGADLIKIMATGGVMSPGVDPRDAHYTAEELAVGVKEAHGLRKRTASHAQGTEGILNAVHAGIDSIEHGIFLTQECIDKMLAAGTYVVPTFAALHNILANADNNDGHKIPNFMIEKCQQVTEAHKASMKLFYEAGGKIAMGTDAGTPHNRHGKNAEELRFMCANGMSQVDTMRMSTFNGADLMGLENHGLIAVNYVADILVVNGDPSHDIEMLADKNNHTLVIKAGKII